MGKDEDDENHETQTYTFVCDKIKLRKYQRYYIAFD